MRQRSVDTNRLLEICPGLENRISGSFDEMLWLLMQKAADKTHLSLEVRNKPIKAKMVYNKRGN